MIDDVIVEPDPQEPVGGSPPQDVPDGAITSDPVIAAESPTGSGRDIRADD